MNYNVRTEECLKEGKPAFTIVIHDGGYHGREVGRVLCQVGPFEKHSGPLSNDQVNDIWSRITDAVEQAISSGLVPAIDRLRLREDFGEMYNKVVVN